MRKGRVITMKELREIIRDLREDHDLKQVEIADYLGVAQQTYSNYENGNRDIPIDIVIKLSKYYKVSTDYLLGAENGYLGSSNLSRTYLGDVTMHDVVYDIQKFNPRERRDLLKFINFLKSSE
jgi:transcriptional regulator with XRE-family HTH domain